MAALETATRPSQQISWRDSVAEAPMSQALPSCCQYAWGMTRGNDVWLPVKSRVESMGGLLASVPADSLSTFWLDLLTC